MSDVGFLFNGTIQLKVEHTEMGSGLRVAVVTKGELRRGADRNWDDPDGFAIPGDPIRDLLLSNPLSDGSDDEPVQVVGLQDERPIGRMDLLYGHIRLDGQSLPILWGSGLLVPEKHRSTGIGLMLLLRSQRLPYAVGAVGPSQLAYPLYQKLGWVDLLAPRYVLLCRSRPVVERFLRSRGLARLVSVPIDIGLGIYRTGLKGLLLRHSRGCGVEPADSMPDALDPLLAGSPIPASCPRSAGWLNWLLLSGPRDNHRRLYLVSNGESTIGYFIVSYRLHEAAAGGSFRDVHLGSVKDWMSFDMSRISEEELILLAVRELLRKPLDAIDVCVSEAHIGRRLRRLGFARKGAMRFMFKPLAGTLLANAEYHRADRWRIRPADGDYMLF